LFLRQGGTKQRLPTLSSTAHNAGMTPEQPTPTWNYTVSVRALCDFTAKRGDLDRRFSPSATATEGLQGQGLVVSRRGQDYETELSLEGQWGPLRVRGRADGYDPRRQCLEEIKTIRGNAEDLSQNKRLLHWAQLETYGALFCQQRGLEQVSLALVYFDFASQTETELRQVFGAGELQALWEERCERFVAWAEQEALHRLHRDEALAHLAFPPGQFRAGQRDLAEAVYRSTLNGRCLLAQAPTGIGKTVGTLFPVLRAAPASGIDKVAFLTCKGTGRLTALETLHALRERVKGKALRVLTLVAKEQACEYPDKACHGDACPLARGFYDRVAAARAQAVQSAWLDAADVRRIGLQHQVCPYYLSQDLVRWADVWVADVNHFFDTRALLWGMMQAEEWRCAVLVDEAHNLVERTRQMYSGELSVARLQSVVSSAPPGVRSALAGLLRASEDWLALMTQPYQVETEASDTWMQSLQTAAAALAEHFHAQPLSVGHLLDFHFDLQHLLRLVDGLGDHSLLELRAPTGTLPLAAGRGPSVGVENQAVTDDASEGLIAVRNVVPAAHLRHRIASTHSLTLFSATLAPPSYTMDLLGMPENSAWMDVPPAFDPEHLSVRVAAQVSTRYADRAESLDDLVKLMAEQFDAHPGNYLSFFSSFEYLDQAAQRLAELRPDVPQWRQDRRMSVAARRDFLAHFVPEGRGIGFAVLGGVFAEGVDLPGSQLIGAFIATLGLPPVSPMQAAVQERMDKIYGEGQAYADLVPAMQRVVQAAGRILRTPEDRGWLLLLDDRYGRSDVRALLPPWWQFTAG
jgi:DNA excision repair protein ERCC-2